MKLVCKCLNVAITTKENVIYNLEGVAVDHLFFKEDIGSVELDSIHKQQASLVVVENCGEWVIYQCINCHLYTHALNIASTAKVLINRVLLTKSEDIESLKNSEKYSPAFKIIVDYREEDENVPVLGARTSNSAGSKALHQQLTEWIQSEASQTEERVRQYTEQQYSLLDRLRTRAHRDYLTLTRNLVEAAKKTAVSNIEAKRSLSQFNSVTNPKPLSPLQAIPVLQDSTSAIVKKSQVANRARNVARKPSVDAEGLFDLEGMEEPADTPPSDEELSDTDDSGSHDEGIHIPRRMSSSIYAKSLPVDVPVFPQNIGSNESPHRRDYRVPQEPMDIAASIKALAKSVHGDTVFGDLPRPRFSSQI